MASRPTAVAPALMADLRVLSADSMRGRGAGTPDLERAAAYVARRFAAIGVEPVGASGYDRAFALDGGGRGHNVVGRLSGTVHPQSVLLVTAHLDHLGVRRGLVYNGADDNASGVAALLAVAEALRRDPPQHTVVFAALDGEEIGLQGAQALAADPPVPLGAILAVVNLDMVARGDGGALWASGAAHYPHLRPILEPVLAAAPVPVRFGHDGGAGSDNWTGASDHAAFHQRGVPFVYFGVEDHADYHTPTDDADRVQPAFFAGAAEAIVAAVRALDGAHAALVAGR